MREYAIRRHETIAVLTVARPPHWGEPLATRALCLTKPPPARACRRGEPKGTHRLLLQGALPETLKNVGTDAFEGCPLGDLTVQSGANFECRCDNLANRLRQLNEHRRPK